MLIGAIALFIYTKFFKKTPEEQAQAKADAMVAKNTVSSAAQSSIVVDEVKNKNHTAGLKVSATHRNIAEGFYVKLKTRYQSDSDMDSIIKSINSMEIATLRLVHEAYGIREKTVNLLKYSRFADNWLTDACVGDLTRHLQASMTDMQLSKIMSKLNKI